LIRHLIDQHGLTRADLLPLLGTPSRVSEVMRGKKGLSMAMVQRLRARFLVPADLLLPPPKKPPPRVPRSERRLEPDRWRVPGVELIFDHSMSCSSFTVARSR
jgi:transcriptional regulator with XRE-family HTH domain